MISVLHVDDDASDLEIAKLSLNRIEPTINIRSVSSAEQGLKVLRDERIDVVISDYQMPKMDGMEFLQAVKNISSDIPFILFTGQGNEEFSSEALLAGADDYFSKEVGFAHYYRLANSITKLARAYKTKKDHLRVSQELVASRKEEIQSRQMLLDMVQSLPIGLVIFQFQEPDKLILVEANSEAEKLAAMSADRVMGIDLKQIMLHPENETLLKELLDAAASGNKLNVERTVYRKDGSSNRFIIHTFNMQEKRFCIYFEQIPDKKQNEQASREDLPKKTHTEEFDSFAENARDLIYRMNLPDGQYTYLNPAVKSIFGYDREEFLQQPLLIKNVIHPEWADYLQMKWDQLLSGYYDPEYEYQIIDKAGNTKWVNQRNYVHFDKDGKPRYIEGIVTDITALKSERTKITLGDDLFTSFFNNSDVGFCIIDNVEGFPYIAVNNVLASMNNKSIIDHLGKTLEELAKDVPAIKKTIGYIEKVLETGKRQIFEVELPGLAEDSKFYYVTCFPLLNDTGKIIAFGLLVFDVTDRKLLELELVEKEVQLDALSENLKSFSYSISHDLRAPVRQLANFTEMLKENYLHENGKDVTKYISHIEKITAKMGKMIEDYLKLGSMTKSGMSKKEIHLKPVISRIVDSLKNEFPDQIVTINYEGDLIAFCDLGLIESVYTNLLTNAWKFAKENKTLVVTVGVKKVNEERVCFVRDNGKGFDGNLAKEIFKPFLRLDPGSQFDGSGLGLSIAKSVIEKHGGRIWAESKIGEGAIFSFTLGKEN